MFDIDAPIGGKEHPELERAARHAARFIALGAEKMVKAGAIEADPAMFGWSIWCALHGIVMLHQSGMLKHGPDYRKFAGFLGSTMQKGAASKGKKR